MIAQLQLHGEATSGGEQPVVQRVVTSGAWEASDGPILQDSTYVNYMANAIFAVFITVIVSIDYCESELES